jgi:hypothetical protein
VISVPKELVWRTITPVKGGDDKIETIFEDVDLVAITTIIISKNCPAKVSNTGMVSKHGNKVGSKGIRFGY